MYKSISCLKQSISLWICIDFIRYFAAVFVESEIFSVFILEKNCDRKKVKIVFVISKFVHIVSNGFHILMNQRNIFFIWKCLCAVMRSVETSVETGGHIFVIIAHDLWTIKNSLQILSAALFLFQHELQYVFMFSCNAKEFFMNKTIWFRWFIVWLNNSVTRFLWFVRRTNDSALWYSFESSCELI